MANDNARPVFDQVNIVAGDMEATLAFYRLLGLEVPDGWKGHHTSADTPEGLDLEFDSTAFAQAWNTGWKGREDLAGRVVLSFKLAARDSVDEKYATLTTAGYKGLQPPFDAFWGARFAIVEDPDGVAVGLMSPVDPAMRSRPPDL